MNTETPATGKAFSIDEPKTKKQTEVINLISAIINLIASLPHLKHFVWLLFLAPTSIFIYFFTPAPSTPQKKEENVLPIVKSDESNYDPSLSQGVDLMFLLPHPEYFDAPDDSLWDSQYK